MVHFQCDALQQQLALITCPRVLTETFRARLAAYNAARRDAVNAGCTVINEQPDMLRGIEVLPDESGRQFVGAGGCTRRVLPGGAVVSRLIGNVNVMYVES